MSKRNLEWSEAKLNRYLKEGRGKGENRLYVPWLKTQDFPSLGKSSRMKSIKTGRIHHFFSATQRNYFLELDWDTTVTDIREHFPLLDLQEVINDLDDVNLNKFRNENLNYILTTTFLITKIGDGNENVHFARSVKYASELDKKITQEKLEIERRYWKAKDIDWKIVTNNDIDSIRIKNLEFINPVVSMNLEIQNLEMISKVFIEKYKNRSDRILYPTFLELEKKYSLSPGTGINIFKYLLANRVFTTNINVQIDIRKPIDLTINY